jgi:plastocyanin
VTNSGASAYLFDQYSGNNPTIYAVAGSTLAFRLAVAGHPFLIQSSGANYSTGLNHVSTTGTVTTAASAQGQVDGTLYWKIPSDAAGTYTYQCSVHGGMVGNIVVSDPTVGSFTSLSVTGNVSATRVQNGGNLEIRSNVAGTPRTWTFDAIGDFNLPVGGNISGSGYVTAVRVITDPRPLANLTPVAGGRAFVSDGNLVAAGNFGALIGGGGANTVPVYSDGTNWFIG